MTEYEITNNRITEAKRIAELEKENTDLKEEINKIAFARGKLEEENAELKRDKQNLRVDLRTARNNLQAKDTAYQLAMEELEYAESNCLFHSDCPTQKENAELKEQNTNLLESCEGATMMYKDLCKAKELLKQWLKTSKASGCDNINIVTDTERFLKECK